MSPTVLLGTVAIEPARWANFATGPVDDAGTPETIRLSRWLDRIHTAGFDGIELWEQHLTAAEPDEAARVLDHPLSIDVFNSYASLDDPDPGTRSAVTQWVRRTGSTGIKFNVGNEPASRDAYAERIAAWLDELPSSVALLCECHHGISIAEDPIVAAEIFAAAGPADRLQAIVHTHEEPDHIRCRFDTYGDRITHVHVNFIDFGTPRLDASRRGGLLGSSAKASSPLNSFATLTTPRLRDIRGRLESQVALLRSLGFDGSWTIEFSHGVLSDQDEPGRLIDEASSDLDVLRDVLA